MKRRIVITLLSFHLSIVYSQVMEPIKVFEKSFVVANEKVAHGKFKGQVLKGKRNGMGFILYKKGDLYAGDFYRDQITGYGLLIASGEINNCNGCKTYVGNWKDGKKSGFGTCYDSNGIPIYQGQFADDKPTGNYPTSSQELLKHFCQIELNDGNYFVGETKEGKPSGFGIIIFNNGDLWQSSFKDGVRKGIGLYLAYDGEWETLNVKGDSYDVISSSENYRIMEETRKANFNKAFSSAMGYFEKAAQTSVELIGEINKNSDGNSGAESENGTYTTDSNNVSKGSSGKSRNANSSGANHANWSSLERSYDNYESQLIRMSNSSNIDKQEVRSIQRKMKEIREKISKQSGGHTRAVSQWENWNP